MVILHINNYDAERKRLKMLILWEIIKPESVQDNSYLLPTK